MRSGSRLETDGGRMGDDFRKVAHDREVLERSRPAGDEPCRMDDVATEQPEAAAAAATATQVPVQAPATLFRNSFFGLTARGFGIAGAALAAILTIRTLSVSDYAVLAAGLAVTTVFAGFTELGVTTVTAREIAQKPEEVGPRLGTALALQLTTSSVCAALLVPVGLLLGYSNATLAVLGIGTAIVLSQGLLAVYQAVFLAKRVFVYIAAYTTLQYGVLVAATALAAFVHADPKGFALATAASYVAALLAAVAAVRLRLGVRPRLRASWTSAPRLLRAAVPIALSGSVLTVYGRIDVVLLSKLGEKADVAIYNVPLIVAELAQVVPAVIATAFFPLLTVQLRDDPGEARTSFDLMARLFLFISVPIAFILGIGGRTILVTAFGQAYSDSGTVLFILAPTIVLAFFTYLLWYGMLAARLERGRVPAVIAGLALNVGLNLWLIPAYGAQGAAIALLASDAFMVTWLFGLVTRSAFPFRWGAIFGRPVLAAITTVLLLLLPLPALAIAVLMSIGYVAILLGMGYIRLEEWRPVTGPVRDVLGRTTGAVRRRIP
jgi:O-antigen/teichoic acid export membrane protein